MKNLSPQTRQKLAILLKSRAKQNGNPLSPNSANMAPPPILNSPLKPASTVSKPLPLTAEHMAQPGKFGLLKNKFKM